MTAADRFPSYRAPQADRQILCAPPWPATRQQLAGQRAELTDARVEFLGTSLTDLARSVRRTAVEAAQRYTSTYSDVPDVDLASGPLIVTGHQPEFVHPGVWLKNFAVAQLAQQFGGVGLSLVIDNDLCRTPSIRVPTGTVEQPRNVDILFDRPQSETPFEERTIVDRALWNSFGERVTQAISPLVPAPLIAQWWSEAVEFSHSTPLLGLATSQARHRLEQSWGSHILEIPQSQICQTAAFQHFALHLLSNAERLRRDYNGALAEYRQAHHLRSPAQPLPDLQEVDGWIETPFWVWSRDDPTRRPLYALPSADELKLSDRKHWHDSLSLTTDSEPQPALQQLANWLRQGLKLRSRALITTLYARLLLADTFIHGIGGAKYDQVTDLLCQRFFDIRPPEYLTLSGTLRLLIDHVSVAANQAGQLRQTLRNLQYHPESHLAHLNLDPASQSEVDAWVAKKHHAIQTPKTKANAAQRHADIAAANRALQPWLEPLRAQTEQALSRNACPNSHESDSRIARISFLPIPPRCSSRFFYWISRSRRMP